MAKISITPKEPIERTFPTDAMQRGVHSSLRVASKHKKLVSGVLHLKRESVGRTGSPTAYGGGRAAFGQQKPSIKVK